MTFSESFIAKCSNIGLDWCDSSEFPLSVGLVGKSPEKVTIMLVKVSAGNCDDMPALLPNVITCLNLNLTFDIFL